MLRESKWVVETTKKAMADAKGDGGKFKAYFRKAHADRLKAEHGLVVEPVTFDPPAVEDDNGALTYRDPSGRPLAPKLTPPPVDGPDVTIKAAAPASRQGQGGRRHGSCWIVAAAAGCSAIRAASTCSWPRHSMNKIETLYATIFEGILGEKISTKPVEIVTPFPWLNQHGKGG